MRTSSRRPVVAVIAALAAIAIGYEAMATESSEMLATSATKAREIALGAGPVEVTLMPPANGAGALASRLAAVKPGRKIHLVVRGLRADAPPEVLYQVYLGLPRGTAAKAEGLHYVGSFNFFNAVQDGKARSTKGPSPRFYSYDVTDLVKILRERKLLDESVTVTIVPAGQPTPTVKPFVGEIALVAQ